MNRREMTKRMKIERDDSYLWFTHEIFMSMFDWKTPFKKEFIEWELINFGAVSIYKKGNIEAVGGLCGFDFDKNYGLPEGHGIVITRHGSHYEGTIGKDIIIGYNNEIRVPEYNLKRYARMFSEIDTSMLTNIRKSRVNPIPIVEDEKQKLAMERAIKRTDEGDTDIIALNDFVNAISDKEPIRTVSITEPEQIERIQYLSKFKDDVLKWFGLLYGIPLNSTGKSAQVSIEEIQGYSTFSRLHPMALLEARKKFIEECNEAFGTDWSVDFSDTWKKEFELTDPLHRDEVALTQQKGNENEDSEELSEQSE